MKQKISAIVYKIKDGKPYYFVGKVPDSSIWKYVTGKVEKGEKPFEAARREIGEELGIYGFRNFFSLRKSFVFGSGHEKIREYIFAQEIPKTKIKLEKREFSQYKFLPLEKAQELVYFDSHKRCLRLVDMALKEQNYPKIFVISGPSGSGKGSVLVGVLKRVRNIKRVKTLMTRQPLRKDDKAGRQRVSVKEFFNLDCAGKLIEKNFYAGYWYGTPADSIEKIIESGKNAILEIDLNGMKALKKKYSNVVSIFLKANFEDLIKRIKSRGGCTEEEIQKRLSIAKKEIAESKICDYIILNKQGQLDKAIDQVIKIIKREK